MVLRSLAQAELELLAAMPAARVDTSTGERCPLLMTSTGIHHRGQLRG
eukprot:COSAG03_NODE_8010_length_845_cov_39.455764_2_plen_47_part_01